MEQAFLERQAFEERFQADVLLGDLTWETSYSLPGEGLPPRTRADISLDWPTWAQSAYRSWYIGEPFEEPPRIEIEIVMRVQRLAKAPDPAAVVAVLPPHSSPIGEERLVRSPPTVETIHDEGLSELEYAVEVSYEGSYELVRGGARRRLRPRRPLRRDGRLDRLDAGAPRRPQVRVPGRRERRRPLRGMTTTAEAPVTGETERRDRTPRILFSILVAVAFPVILRVGVLPLVPPRRVVVPLGPQHHLGRRPVPPAHAVALVDGARSSPTGCSGRCGCALPTCRTRRWSLPRTSRSRCSCAS